MFDFSYGINDMVECFILDIKNSQTNFSHCAIHGVHYRVLHLITEHQFISRSVIWEYIYTKLIFSVWPKHLSKCSRKASSMKRLIIFISVSTSFKMVGPLTYEDQFIQVTTDLPSSYLYGFGENTHSSFRHSFTPRQTFPIFAKDQPVGEVSLYSVCYWVIQ